MPKKTTEESLLIQDEQFIEALREFKEITASQRQHAIALTRLVIDYEKKEQYAADEILEIFEKSLTSIKGNAGIEELMALLIRDNG